MTPQQKTFSKIYDKYIEKIYRFIFLKVNSKEIAEDLTSETFLKAWESFKEKTEKNEKIENISAFLYQIAKNLVFDYYRQKEKFQTLPLDSFQLADSKTNLQEKEILNSDFEIVKKALFQLNEDYQNVLIWYYLDGISIREIAKMLDKSESATRVLIHRALSALRENFDKIQKGIV
jgi:RNA polymerase sigma-70 factor (ECF subfamily)